MPRAIPAKSVSEKSYKAWMPRAKNWIGDRYQQTGDWVSQNWFRLLIIGLLTFILLRKDVSLQLDLQNGQSALPTEKWSTITRNEPAKVTVSTSPAEPILDAQTDQQMAYIKRFARVAQKEMTEFGIPASITLAQGLLETNAGNSPLATRHNNHFGLKCFSRTCQKGHCTNFSDDSHKDFFRKFTSAWESYRAHSLLLANSERYKKLFELPKGDYKGWAKGLKDAGYATDRHYARKLIHLIESRHLYEYDA